ncbi:error-prone DNA polymerase [Corynebacterium suicordis]|uniref:Error-prone DNA polymerase n=1 Tax=Corynebacterium suicordis DSM 45110 TaxID=1121369 RepID=A0ABR9ZHP1_9CORY|nr:error-prone DNA polymerase [Corynebacterium suicordis]MBF4552966.1 error-prone DNA polymerase [Corynebacterium suicordis DSM 45110]
MNAASLSWSRLERILSSKSAGTLHAVGIGEGQRVEYFDKRYDPEADGAAGSSGSGGSSGAAGSGAESTKAEPAVPFAELHACSAYNFLRGASEPEEIVEQAVELGISALGCVDRDGFYGAARFAAAAAERGVPTVFGAELSIDGAEAAALTVLCRGQEGYRRLSRLMTDAHMADRDKDVVVYPPVEEIARYAFDEHEQCHWLIVLGWEMRRRTKELVRTFGADNCVVELVHTMQPVDVDHNDELHVLAMEYGLREIVSSAPTCANPQRARLAGVKRALHERKDVRAAETITHPLGGAWMRSGAEMMRLAGDNQWLRDAVATTVEVARECTFTLNLIAPQLPHFPVPEGHTEMSWLREVTARGATVRYGARPKEAGPEKQEGVDQSTSATARAWATIDRELLTIEKLGFPGYFLIVHDIVSFCHSADILCQGRGSAANSAVCFALGITNVDAVAAGLLFERFLSPERDGPPDIDVDIESGRREEAIQYVYARYGRDNAAQVANVITYRRKGALRDAARALGYAPGQVDAWARGTEEPPELVSTVAGQLKGQPRHLGIHSGGMVICDRPTAEVVPTEWARMENRSVVQWDKDDCATVGLVKFDLLGLGMLEAIHHALDQVRTHRGGRNIELWRLDPVEKEVYDMLTRADAIGVFQVESRAQLNTLPRLRPRTFYDLVVEVALIRPGPIQGGSVHPYIRRRNGEEPVVFDHPCLEPALSKTLGIPLFQEQLMQVVVDAAGFSGAEADTLRRAMGSKRSPEKMEQLRQRFYNGLRETNGITGEVADRLWDKIVAFASYGFPESHAQSFASLVYYSAWLKHHYPAEFCVALLRAQPMGFYSPQSLIADARRHGVRILPVHINESDVQADAVIDFSTPPPTTNTPRGIHGLGRGTAEPVGALRMGLASIKGIGKDVATRIVEVRERLGEYRTISDLSREADLTVAQVEHLARAGALEPLGMSRRQAVWAAGIAATERAGMLPGTSHVDAPVLPGMSSFELAAADLASTGVTPDGHPVELLRGFLNTWHEQPIRTGAKAGQKRGGVPVVASEKLLEIPDGTRIRVGGMVTHRQRPMTAGGAVFFGLEDETGMANVMVTSGLWTKQRIEALSTRLVVIRGIVHNATGAASVTADLLEPVEPELVAAGMGQAARLGSRSRDFQ